MRSGVLATVAILALAGPAQAGRCMRPYAPVVKVKPNATEGDVTALRGDVNSFMKASDLYQNCLYAADADEAMIAANQAEKERVGREFNTLLHSFKSAHPG